MLVSESTGLGVCRSSCLTSKHVATRPNKIGSCRRLAAQPGPAGSLPSSSHCCKLRYLSLPTLANRPRRADVAVHAGRSAANFEGGSPASMLTKGITQEIAESESLEELENTIIQWSSSFDAIHVSAVFNKAAKHAGRQPQKAWPLARTVAKAWDQLLQGAEPRALASVLWGAAQLKFTDERLWKDTLDAFVQWRSVSAANCRDLANIAYALALIAQGNKCEVPGVPRADLLAALRLIMDEAYVFATSPAPDADTVNAQHLSNLLWACAHLRFNPGNTELDALVQAYSRNAVLEQALPVTHSGIQYAICTLVTDCGYQPRIAERIWRKLFADELVMKRMANDLPATVSSAAYHTVRLWCFTPSCITIDLARDSMGLLLNGRAAQKMRGWTLRDVPTVLWALAMLDMQDELWFVKAATDELPSLLHKQRLGPTNARRLGVAHRWLVKNGVLGGDGLAQVLTAEQLQQCTTQQGDVEH